MNNTFAPPPQYRQCAPLFTIVVPFYNSAGFVERCVKSLQWQSFGGFECVFIDDGSTDGGGKLCKKLLEGDKRFCFLQHKTNLGLGAGRVNGIKAAKTKYIYPIDIDDEVSTDAAQIIYESIKETLDADIIIFDYEIQKSSGQKELVTSSNGSTESVFLENSALIPHVWNKIFKTELLKRIDLDFLSSVTFAEDLFTCVSCFLLAKKAAFVRKNFYTYIYNNSSCVHSRNEKSFYDNTKVSAKLMQFALRAPDEIAGYIRRNSFNSFNQFIFPNEKNDFQWKRPHFDEYRRFPKVPFPPDASRFGRAYINQIRKHHDKIAELMWLLLKARELLRNRK